MVGRAGLSSYELVVGDVEEAVAEGAGCAGDRERVEEAMEGGRVRDRFQRGSEGAGREPIERGEAGAVRESDALSGIRFSASVATTRVPAIVVPWPLMRAASCLSSISAMKLSLHVSIQ